MTTDHTPDEVDRDLLLHALGGPDEKGRPKMYRNYFVASKDSTDDQRLQNLVQLSFVEVCQYPHAEGMRLYRVTTEGVRWLEKK